MELSKEVNSERVPGHDDRMGGKNSAEGVGLTQHLDELAFISHSHHGVHMNVQHYTLQLTR